jgi:hypothetical protein
VTQDLNIVRMRREILGVVRRLGCNAEEQIRWLDETELPVEELVIEFKDLCYTHIPSLVEAGALSRTEVSALQEIAAAVQMLLTTDLFTDDALLSAHEWNDLRSLAGSMVTSFDSSD